MIKFAFFIQKSAVLLDITYRQALVVNHFFSYNISYMAFYAFRQFFVKDTILKNRYIDNHRNICD